MFRSLKNSLNKYFEKEKIKPIYKTGVVMDLWSKTVGKTIYENTKIINIKKNTLIIQTTTPVWRNELLFQKQTILKKLNQSQNGVIIKDIHFI